jgi:hypothetical protein
MFVDKVPQGEVTHGIAIVDENRLVIMEKIFNVFYSPGRVEKDHFMPEDDREPFPLPLRKHMVVLFGTVMGIHDKPFYAR